MGESVRLISDLPEYTDSYDIPGFMITADIEKAFDSIEHTFISGFNLLTPIFMLPYIIMDLPIFVMAEWATLLVDIHCPRGGS